DAVNRVRQAPPKGTGGSMLRKQTVPGVVGTPRRSERPAPRKVSPEPRRTADPASASDVAMVLNQYLAKRLHSTSLTFQKLPEEYPDGWETHTYSFHLRSSGRLPRSFGGPLIARIYLDRQGIPRARHECAVMR